MSSKIAHYAVAAGLCAFVPVPFLDLWLERKALRAMYAALAESEGTPLDAAAIEVLVEDRSSLLLGCLGMALIWPIKKLFRTFLYFLTVKDVIDATAAAAIRAHMVRDALTRLPGGARAVRDTMDATLDRYQYSPVSRFLFRGERPSAPWLVPDDVAGRSVGWLYEKAGGGAILDDFRKRLENLP